MTPDLSLIICSYDTQNGTLHIRHAVSEASLLFSLVNLRKNMAPTHKPSVLFETAGKGQPCFNDCIRVVKIVSVIPVAFFPNYQTTDK